MAESDPRFNWRRPPDWLWRTAMPVEDFESVRAGQVIAQLADDDYRARSRN